MALVFPERDSAGGAFGASDKVLRRFANWNDGVRCTVGEGARKLVEIDLAEAHVDSHPAHVIRLSHHSPGKFVLHADAGLVAAREGEVMRVELHALLHQIDAGDGNGAASLRRYG